MEASDNQGLWGGPEGAGGLGGSALRGRHCHLLRVAPGPLLYLWHLGRPCICGTWAAPLSVGLGQGCIWKLRPGPCPTPAVTARCLSTHLDQPVPLGTPGAHGCAC